MFLAPEKKDPTLKFQDQTTPKTRKLGGLRSISNGELIFSRKDTEMPKLKIELFPLYLGNVQMGLGNESVDKRSAWVTETTDITTVIMTAMMTVV